jgi:HEAT repeat protein
VDALPGAHRGVTAVGLFDIFRTNAPPSAHDPAVLLAIEEAGRGRGLMPVFELLPYLPPGASMYGLDAARAVDALVAGATPEDVAAFDAIARSGGGPPRRAWDAVEFGPADGWASAHPGLLAIATCHRNGHVRERAIRRLGATREPFALPFFVVRLNDWVAPVRFGAAEAVKARIDPAYARAWVLALGLLARVQSGQRGAHAWVLGPVDALLRRPESRDALEHGLRHGPVGVRRACVRIAARTRDAEPLLRLALANPDPVTSSAAAAALCVALEGTRLCDVLAVMERGNPTVRARALETRVARFPEEVDGALRAALFDAAARVREIARHHLRQRGAVDADFARDSRDALASARGPRFVAALKSLAEIGTAADLDLFVRYADDPRAAVREAAIHGLGRTGGLAEIDRIRVALADANLGVAKMARRYARLYLGRGAAPIRRPR